MHPLVSLFFVSFLSLLASEHPCLCLYDSPLSLTLYVLSVRGLSAFTMEPARLCNRDRVLAQLVILSSQVFESFEIGANAAATSPDEQSSNYAKSNHYSGSCFTPCRSSDRTDRIYLLDFRYDRCDYRI